MLDMEFIESFLAKVEGARVTIGYIPCHIIGGGSTNYKGTRDPGRYSAMGASGVTIATGCDLGQTDAATLRGYGLEERIIQIYQPYLGKRRSAALVALHKQPLRISGEDAAATDRAVHNGYLNRYVRPAYERASGALFDDLPREAQAVVMSVCYQKGCGGVARDWPKLWAALVSRDWGAASRELQAGFSQYRARRIQEGKLLAGVGR